jgi:hypothetical protein
VVLKTQTLRCQISKIDGILEIHQIGNYEHFSCIGNSLQCYNKNKDCDEAIVEKLQGDIEKIRKSTRMTRLSVTRFLIRMLGNLFLDYSFISRRGAMEAVLYPQ